MAEKRLIGRIEEVKRLGQCMESREAQLVVIYGRRRVGKTFLVDSYFEKNYAFSFTGAYNQPRRTQLMNFADELRLQTGMNVETPKTWRDAFILLRKHLDSQSREEKQVVFNFDMLNKESLKEVDDRMVIINNFLDDIEGK